MPALKPLYQGKVDTFCAIYAVLNCLRLTHGIRTLKARGIFNDTLMALAREPESFAAVLEQTTDYISLVDGMLQAQRANFPLETLTPYTPKNAPNPADFWKCCRDWMQGGVNRSAIFRFMRHVTPGSMAINRHWTTLGSVDDTTLHLFDSSHDAEAVMHIRHDSFVTRKQDINENQLIYIQPETLRLVRLTI